MFSKMPLNYYLEKPQSIDNQKVEPVEKKKKAEKESEPDKISRRGFLKLGAKLGALGAASLVVKKNLFEDDNTSSEKEEKPKEVPRATEEQKEILEENRESIREIIDYDKKSRIEFGPKNIEALRNHWRQLYSENPKMVKSFKDAYFKMGAWKKYLISEFEEIGFTKKEAEQYIYLAIPESHWQFDAKSPVGATGAYQFMPGTARKFGLEVTENYDERMDPVISARACAKHLMDIKYKTGDMDVSLSGYNGGFVWEYIRNGGKDYEGFARFLETKVNELRDEIKNLDHLNHRVRKGQTISGISRKYGCSIQEIVDYNQLKDASSINVNQKLKIPLNDANRKKIYYKKVAGYAENMVYPAKFDSIRDLIEEGFVQEEKESLDFEEKDKFIVEASFRANHVAKAGDNLWRLSFNYKVSQEEIMTANNMKDKTLKKGTSYKIPAKNQINTLGKIAKEKKVSLSRLIKLNPGVIDYKKPIPRGAEVRL